MNLNQINTATPSVVQKNAPLSSEKLKWKKIKKISKLEQQEPVFNLEVEGVHNFAVNNGLIVHNCMDALRYSLVGLRISAISRIPESNRAALMQPRHWR